MVAPQKDREPAAEDFNWKRMHRDSHVCFLFNGFVACVHIGVHDMYFY